MRIAKILWTLSMTWSVAALAAEESYPAPSSFIIQLADAAIDAEGIDAGSDQDLFRQVFADSFLLAFLTFRQDQDFGSERPIPRISYRGQQAGYAYRAANPDSLERVMREYANEPYEVVGEYFVRPFSSSHFMPENESVRPFRTTTFPCWSFWGINIGEMPELMQRLFTPEERRAGSRKRVRVTGFLSPLKKVEPGQENIWVNDGFECERTLYATNVREIAKETK